MSMLRLIGKGSKSNSFGVLDNIFVDGPLRVSGREPNSRAERVPSWVAFA
jgi:hypothetical protein